MKRYTITDEPAFPNSTDRTTRQWTLRAGPEAAASFNYSQGDHPDYLSEMRLLCGKAVLRLLGQKVD